jgi:hypothetical protein
MTLLERAEKAAKKNGKKLDPEVAKGLKAIQAMHDIAEKVKGSAYQIYMDVYSGKKRK